METTPELVTVYVASDPNHAPIAESLLRAHNIWFFQQEAFTNAALGSGYPIAGPVNFQVRPEDAARARAILDSSIGGD